MASRRSVGGNDFEAGAFAILHGLDFKGDIPGHFAA
jgi:hypothetical protein